MGALFLAVALTVAPPPSCSNLPRREPKSGRIQVQLADVDLDGDGKPDTVRIVNAGSGADESRADAEVRLTTRTDVISVHPITSSTRFLSFTAVPDALGGERMDSARRAVADALFGGVCVDPDPSLQWLLDPTHALRWNSGPAVFPESYTVTSSELRLRDRARQEGELKSTPRAVWVTYLGANHRRDAQSDLGGTFRVLDTRGDQRLLGTAHGVVLRDDQADRYAWLYIQEGGQTLRRMTIAGARFEEQVARIEVQLDQNRERGVVRVSLGSGQVTSARFCTLEAWDETRHACNGS